MTKKKKKLFIILLVIFVLLGWWCYKHSFTGSRSGRVIDALTSKPIEGAVVCMQWETGGFMGVVGGSYGAFYETKTDKDGKYRVPSLRIHRFLFLESVHENVMVYKDGYSAYKVSGNVGRSFGHKEENQPYRKKRNLVRLCPFKRADSHTDHLRWIETFGIHDWPEQLLEIELQKEIEREREER